jgi:hypothetical protein
MNAIFEAIASSNYMMISTMLLFFGFLSTIFTKCNEGFILSVMVFIFFSICYGLVV